ncbi:MAG: peptidoglycan DD-metalloendopeptidase family protein [Rikenellaceae bacterium]
MSIALSAQNIEDLQNEIRKAEDIIKLTNEQLSSNKITQENRREKLMLIGNNINTRKGLIKKLDSEIKIYNNDIYSASREIKKHEQKIASLRNQYKNIVVETYRQLKQNNYMKFIFSADSFHEIFRRLHYLRLHSNTSTSVVVELAEQMALLSVKTENLNAKKATVKKSLDSKQNEVSTLASEQMQFNNELKKLQSTEKNLTSVISKNQESIQKLQDEIKKIIEEEARKHRGETDEKKRALNVKLSSTFTENKGKFPMPVERGVIIEKFGVHAHSLQKSVTINNKGVNISVTGNSNVHTIFEGEVTKIFFFKGLGNNVMIRHGNYISVYSNLSKVSVKVGQKVKTLDKIGVISPKEGASSSQLHFELWHETTPQNPELWLKQN